MTRYEAAELIRKSYEKGLSKKETISRLTQRGVKKADAVLMVNDYFDEEEE